MNTDIPITKAIIPEIGEPIKSRHLHSLAEAFNSRILNGAGDAHWRIPYYIFSTYFRKPRLNNDMLYAPDSEFFDFYQFVNPSTNNTWPVETPQQAEGANLQTNFLNRFIFGMNYERKEDDPTSQQVGINYEGSGPPTRFVPSFGERIETNSPGGYYVYEREDVRSKKAQDLMKRNDSSFRGYIFPYFNDIGALTATDSNYTAFGLASEINSPGYISGQPTNPAGNSFGGYYGSRPTVVTGDGCGTDKDQNGNVIAYYPSSVATISKIDGLKAEKNSQSSPTICADGIGSSDIKQYSEIYNSIFNYIVQTTTINNDGTPSVSGEIFSKNRHHLDQYQAGVFFNREQKNHIHRLLYNYISYAKNSDPSKGFDFDWFFRNQYAYAPEIGYLNSINFTYNAKSTDVDKGYPTKIEFQILPSRPSFNASLTQLTSGLFVVDANINYIKIYFNTITPHPYAVGDRVYLIFTNDQGSFTDGVPVEGNYIINFVNVNLNTNSNYFTVPAKQAFSLYGAGFKVEIKPYLKIDGNEVSFKQEAIKQSINANFYFSNSQIPITEVFSNNKTATINYLNLAGYLDQNYSKERLLGNLHTGVDKFTVSANNDFYYGLQIPLFYTLHSIEINTDNLKNLTVRLHVFINDEEAAYRDFDYDFSETSGTYTVISDAALATLDEREIFSFKFSLQNYTAKTSGVIGLTIRPVFLMYYKPKIEDAYALLRAATYSGMDDAKLDDIDHPLKTSSNLTDDLKVYGYIRSGHIPEYLESHNPNAVELNTNAFFETARRLSLFTRIVNGANNFLRLANSFELSMGKDLGAKEGNVLVFDRYARQNGNVGMFSQNGKKPKYSNETIPLSRPYNAYTDFNVLNAGDIQKINDIKNKLKDIDTTGDSVKACESYVGYSFYQLNLVNGKFIYDFNNDLIKALGEEATIVSRNSLVFKTTDFTITYDAIITNDENFSNYEYYKFEDINGNFLSDDIGPYIIKFTPENSQSELGYEKIYLSIDPDTNLPMSSVDITNPNLANKFIYIFKRFPDNTCLKNKQITLDDFFYIDRFLNIISNQSSSYPVCNYIGNFLIKVSSNKLVFEEKNAEIIQKNIWPRDGNDAPVDLLSNETILSSDTIKTITLSLSDLKEIGEILYYSYASDNIYIKYSPSANNGQGDISYDPNGSFTDPNTGASINSPFGGSFNYNIYNNQIAGFKINISYLPDIFPEVKAAIDNSKILKNATVTLTLTSSNISTAYSFNQDITLPLLASDSDSIILDISVNNYQRIYNAENYNQDTGEPIKTVFFNPPVYLYIKNSIYKTGDFDNLPIIREGSLFITRTVNKIDTSEDLPETRDIFQGIAPDYNGVASGSLLIGEEYTVYGGSINHNGFTISANLSFKAANTQFSANSGNPIVKKTNGIISVAPPESFTNEWALWINFLPYSGFDTSIWKEEVYGATNSPFIDRCHVNSLNLPKSLENRYLNYNLPSAYAPEAPPSYRYMPLTTAKPYLVFENVVNSSKDTENIIGNFQLGCPAFKPPYKIKAVYTITGQFREGQVFVVLDRSIDGYYNNYKEIRHDYNGLTDWNARKASFKYGDAALTHKNGISQIATIYGNGYFGSYYPRFFFVKLIPKPRSDDNSNENETDTPLYHEHLKQAELYLEAMREGFTENRSDSVGSSCSIVGGYLTPPDFKYDQLLFSSTSTAEYFGNRWPSLNTFSYNFNKAGNSIPIRYEDNPVGYSAIPNLGAYAEQYVSIAKSINRLVSFRVPYPIDFIVTQETRNDNYALNSVQWKLNDPYQRQGGNSGPYWYNNTNQTNYSGQTLRSTTVYNLRQNDGSLGSVTSSQGFYVNDNTPADQWTAAVQLQYGSFDLNYIKNTISTTLIDRLLLNFGYSHISNLLNDPFTSFPASIQSVKSIYKIQPAIYDPSNFCGDYYLKDGSYNKINYVQEVDFACAKSLISELNPDPLLIGTPFFRIKNPVGGDSCQNLQGTSFVSVSSKSLTIYEPGFKIITLLAKDNIKD
jgi:hypothetical protein